MVGHELISLRWLCLSALCIKVFFMKIMFFRYVVLGVILAPIVIPGCCCIGRYWLAMNADLPVRNMALAEEVEIQLDSSRRIVLPKGLVLRSLDKSETDPIYPDTETFRLFRHNCGSIRAA